MNYDKKQFKKDLAELMLLTNDKQELYDKLVQKSYPKDIVAEALNIRIHKKDIERNKFLFYSFIAIVVIDSIVLLASNRSIIVLPTLMLTIAVGAMFGKCRSITITAYSFICFAILTTLSFFYPNDIFTAKWFMCVILVIINFIISILFGKKLCKTLVKQKVKYYDKNNNIKYKLTYKLK